MWNKSDGSLKMKNIETAPDTEISILTNNGEKRFKLYSQEGLETLAALWVKAGAEQKIMYEPTWMGMPIIQFPEDIVAMQELIWTVRPDLIVECGVAHGGSLIFYASLCQTIGKGKIIGVDVEIRPHNRKGIENHFLSSRISLIEGSSIESSVVEEVQKYCQKAETVLVILDSNHHQDHVAAEMQAYYQMVSPGSYLVVMDGAAAYVWDIPRGQASYKNNHPLLAIESFLKQHPEFETDDHYTRFHITSNPGGFLKRKNNP